MITIGNKDAAVVERSEKRKKKKKNEEKNDKDVDGISLPFFSFCFIFSIVFFPLFDSISVCLGIQTFKSLEDMSNQSLD